MRVAIRQGTALTFLLLVAGVGAAQGIAQPPGRESFPWTRQLRPGEPVPPERNCRSAVVASPDNECGASYETYVALLPPSAASGGSVVTDMTTVVLSCSSRRGGFGTAVLRTHGAIDRIGLGWKDATTLVVAIPHTSRFARPVEQADNLGVPLRIEHQVLDDPRAKMRNGDLVLEEPECFARVSDAQQLTAAVLHMQPPVGDEAGWLARSSNLQCLLTRTIQVRPPPAFSVLVLRFWHAVPEHSAVRGLVMSARQRDADGNVVHLSWRLAPGEASTRMTPEGPLLGFRSVGADAQRAFEAVRDGRPLWIEGRSGDSPPETVEIPGLANAPALDAFVKCRRNLPAP